MLTIAYPEPSFRVKKQGDKDFIFDIIRKKWLLLTPEEWVRQNFVQYLLQVKKYPVTLVALEKMIMLGELRKRFDILVYDPQHRPWMMIECKSPSVQLDESVLHQLLRYHMSVPTGWLVITNGEYSFAWEKMNGQLHGLSELPEWRF
ncbi:MAG: type I restriction enzyme HsdR N-terminal domain-containing protein [Chitinophagaceae bacterium]|nr:MAG: type I restriction enzyme HsdR N-terminal domain-containing protein [Chitinophagaceae bacterium]